MAPHSAGVLPARRLPFGEPLIVSPSPAPPRSSNRRNPLPLSTSRQTAEFLRQNNLDLKPIAATFEAESILPYLRCRQFWYAGTERYGSYGSWDRTFVQNRLAPPTELISRITRHFPEGQRPLIIFRRPVPDPEAQGYRPIPTAPDFAIRMTDEAFFLYEPIPPIRSPKDK